MGTENITRQRVSWSRWCARRMAMVTSHPYVWVWVAPDGTERTFSTKREALEAAEALS